MGSLGTIAWGICTNGEKSLNAKLLRFVCEIEIKLHIS